MYIHVHACTCYSIKNKCHYDSGVFIDTWHTNEDTTLRIRVTHYSVIADFKLCPLKKDTRRHLWYRGALWYPMLFFIYDEWHIHQMYRAKHKAFFYLIKYGGRINRTIHSLQTTLTRTRNAAVSRKACWETVISKDYTHTHTYTHTYTHIYIYIHTQHHKRIMGYSWIIYVII